MRIYATGQTPIGKDGKPLKIKPQGHGLGLIFKNVFGWSEKFGVEKEVPQESNAVTFNIQLDHKPESP